MRKKYPGTVHLPWSPGYSTDDMRLDSLQYFESSNLKFNIFFENVRFECHFDKL